jgi:acetylornithine aminotransferase
LLKTSKNNHKTEKMTMNSALMPIYPNRLPVAFEKGSGVWLTDTQGEKYLDALAGIAVCGLGHAHPAITQTICEQAEKLIHTSNTYHIPEQEKALENIKDAIIACLQVRMSYSELA